MHLDPRRAQPLISRIERSRLAVVSELVRRDDFITLGRMLDASTEEMLADFSMTSPTTRCCGSGCTRSPARS